MSVPHPLRDDAGLSLAEVDGVLLGSLEIGSEEDVDRTLQEVEQFVLFGVHLPFVTNAWSLDRKGADPTTIELNWEELNLGVRPTHAKWIHPQSVSIGCLRPGVRGT